MNLGTLRASFKGILLGGMTVDSSHNFLMERIGVAGSKPTYTHFFRSAEKDGWERRRWSWTNKTDETKNAGREQRKTGGVRMRPVYAGERRIAAAFSGKGHRKPQKVGSGWSIGVGTSRKVGGPV